MASQDGKEVDVTPGVRHVASVFSLPPALTLRGPRMVLKSPSPEDDATMREIVSDPITIQYLPHFVRPGGWTLEDIVLRREKLHNDQLQGKGLTLFIHLLNTKEGDKSMDDKEDCSGTSEDDTVLIGTTGFTTMDMKSGIAEIGIILHKPYWRKGLATEALFLCLRYAFESLGIERVDWFTSVLNKDMRGWCEQLLQLTPFSIYIDGMGDSMRYSLFQSEWRSGVSQLLEQKVYSRKG